MGRLSACLAAIGLIMAFSADGQEKQRPPQPDYKAYFTDQALRADLVHTGTKGKEMFGIEELVVEPIWPGTRMHLVDPTGYGLYRFEVFDKASGRLVFSQGYCSLFGEWLTTAEAAAGMVKSMSEPIRFPLPKAAVDVALEVRDPKTGQFAEIQRFTIDATAYDLRRENLHAFEVETLHDGGREPARAVDVVILPDGYTAREEQKMLLDARRFTQVLLGEAPFIRHQADITVRLVKAFSAESGPDEPDKGLFRDTVLDTTFDTFRSPRYLTTSNIKTLREVSSLTAYDTIIVLVNTARYGGGGIFGLYSIFPSDSEYDEYVLIHEFGHGFGALGDEYFTSTTSYDEDAFYPAGVEPWEPNLTIQTDPALVKWRHLFTANATIPTPDTEAYKGAVGLFEGGGYKAKGIFRPTADSKMFHKGLKPFGPVNEEAIERMIRYFTGEEVSP